jgi:hypothetical protein
MREEILLIPFFILNNVLQVSKITI